MNYRWLILIPLLVALHVLVLRTIDPHPSTRTVLWGLSCIAFTFVEGVVFRLARTR